MYINYQNKIKKMFEITPPKESMGRRPRRIQELMFEFAQVQHDFLTAINAEVELEEFAELNSDEQSEFQASLQLELNSYEAIQGLIDNY